ncbi:UNKNOWN [Stylonychia lemnae]|uniref:Transmembrane protein n=1 Tax=Stylonychia lemnae TaxID=5949 RepID=A0A078B6A4_STYLE|nr:UNKNOWN [Stylonychia lemnae]|eukprot:CDW89078.1 UNKNOWN [Stylonychia lemnae]
MHQQEQKDIKQCKQEEQRIDLYFNFEESAVPNIVSDDNLTTVRIALLIPSLLTFIGGMFVLSPLDMFLFFTNWGMHIVNISLILSILAKTDRWRKNLAFKKWAGILNEIAFISQFAIVTIYWPVLHSYSLEIVEKIRVEHPDMAWKVHHLIIYLHSIPALSIFLNVFISKLVFFYEHARGLVIYSTVYYIVNFLGTKYRGKPIYPFLTWEDWWSLVICIIIVLPNYYVYLGVCALVRYFRPPPNQIKTD